MPFSDDHRAISDTVAGWSQGVNPDGRPGSGESDLPPDLFSRMMKGEISPHAAREEWKERAPGQRKFNDQIRAQARGGGYTADTAQVMSQAGSDGGAPVAVRDAQSGQYVNLDEAARGAGHKTVPGDGIVPQPGPPADPIRRAYYRMLEQREGP